MTLAEAEAKPRKPLFALKSARTILAELDAMIGDEPPKSGAARAIVLSHIRKTLAEARRQAEAELLASGKGTNVLFLDSRIEFVEAERLATLGLPAVTEK